MARIIGQKRAREVWFLCEFYNAQQALDWGLINKVVEYNKLEETTVEWSQKNIGKISSCITNAERCSKCRL